MAKRRVQHEIDDILSGVRLIRRQAHLHQDSGLIREFYATCIEADRTGEWASFQMLATPKVVKTLLEQLLGEEVSDIVQKIEIAAHNIQRAVGRLHLPEDQPKSEEDQRLLAFVQSFEQKEPIKGQKTTTVYQAFLGWCDRVRVEPQGQTSFTFAMRRLGYRTEKRGGGVRYFYLPGVRV